MTVIFLIKKDVFFVYNANVFGRVFSIAPNMVGRTQKWFFSSIFQQIQLLNLDNLGKLDNF